MGLTVPLGEDPRALADGPTDPPGPPGGDHCGVVPAERQCRLHLSTQLTHVAAEGGELALVRVEPGAEVVEPFRQPEEDRAEQPVQEASGGDHGATEHPHCPVVDVIETELVHDRPLPGPARSRARAQLLYAPERLSGNPSRAPPGLKTPCRIASCFSLFGKVGPVPSELLDKVLDSAYWFHSVRLSSRAVAPTTRWRSAAAPRYHATGSTNRSACPRGVHRP